MLSTEVDWTQWPLVLLNSKVFPNLKGTFAQLPLGGLSGRSGQGGKSDREYLILATSGSTSGLPKFVVYTKSKFFAVAEAANTALEVAEGDAWLNVLPLFHVGGLAILARAFVGGQKIINIWSESYRWDPHQFFQLAQAVQWTSLVPTQLYDLVTANLEAPRGLKGILIGGAPIADELFVRATELGWPIVPCFGMTETGSFFSLAKPRLPFCYQALTHVASRITSAGVLEISSPYLFDGYLVPEHESVDGSWAFLATEKWWSTGERVQLVKDQGFQPLGRDSNFVKILGEGVQIESVEREVRARLPAELRRGFCVVPILDARRGFRLELWVEDLELDLEDCEENQKWSDFIENFNRAVQGPMRLSGWVATSKPLVSELGKTTRHSGFSKN